MFVPCCCIPPFTGYTFSLRKPLEPCEGAQRSRSISNHTMKTVNRQIGRWMILSALLTLHFAVSPRGSAETLNFDNFSPGHDHVGVPNGYGGLQWNNFGIYCGACRPASEGYRTGTVSPTNVAFNFYGDPASISSVNPFDLSSAQLTAAWNLTNVVQVRVEGFAGTNVTYDNTYTVQRGAPTLVQFNYHGVTKVRFTTLPAAHFAMDDLTYFFPGSCGASFSPGGRWHGFVSETGTVSVAVPDGCTWTVSSANPWVTILSSLANSNSGTVSYAVEANPTPFWRSGLIRIANQNFSLSQAPTPSPPVVIGPLEIATIGSFTFSNAMPRPFPSSPSTLYYLIDQYQYSGGGGVLPSVSVNWDTNTQFTLTISAPAGHKFRVQVPAGKVAHFGGILLWESTRGGQSPVVPLDIS